MNRMQALLLAYVTGLLLLGACSSDVPASTAAPGALGTQDHGTPTVVVEGIRAPTPTAAVRAGLVLRSDAFADGGEIPARYTCDGENASPALSWSGVPADALALALIVYDPDAGRDLGASTDLGFIHWMVTDLPVTVAGLPASATGNADARAGGMEAANDFVSAIGATSPGGSAIRGTGYDGPCPPARHTYVFRLMALDQPVGLPAGTPAQSILQALDGHVLAAADWTGMYPPAP